MSKSIKVIIIAVMALFLASFSETVVEARAGATCNKVGQVRKFGGVSYTCTAGKGKKARKTWVATGSTTATPVVTTATWNCGSSFTNDQYPQFRLNDLYLKPATQTLFMYPKDSSCQVDVQWTPSSDRTVNKLRNVSVCWTEWEGWPSTLTLRTSCSEPYYLPSDGRLTINWWTEQGTDLPFYGFWTYSVKGYIGENATSVWASPQHLAFYDIDVTSLPASFNYQPLNGVLLS